MKKKDKSGWMAIKIDLEKAYGNLSSTPWTIWYQFSKIEVIEVGAMSYFFFS